MRPGYAIVRHPSISDDKDGWLVGYLISVHGVVAPMFNLHKSKIVECKTDTDYEELMCDSADDLMQCQRDGVIDT